MSSSLRASTNYVWSTSNILGKGATGAVFQGIHKTTGEAVAVKTFNQLSHMRPYEVQMREFEVLKKVKHENIVKLLAIEQELENHSKVLVMELCTGGSLFTILDDPENTFGVCEDEFLLVLKHLTDGMKHLRDNNVVHRDLKPGNIMRYITEDGRSIYKLTDFGAARELEDDQQFVSLYGTEEYLHPDMYERAVLRKLVGKAFGATVDLWSIGVTLYHVATGSLPFRPFGGRKNRETMYSITTKKESGVISGVQMCDNGPIEWSRELPSTCQLSVGLRKFVTPLLAGLMECDATRMWSFDHFFAETTSLLRRRRLFVFHVEKCRLHSLYVDRNDRLDDVRCLVFEQTDAAPEKQQLFFSNQLLEEAVGVESTVGTYSDTTPDNPIFLLATGDAAVAVPVEETPIPKFPNFSPAVTVEQDNLISKSICSVGYCVKRSIERHALIHKLTKVIAATLNAVVVSRYSKLKRDLDNAEIRLEATNQKAKLLLQRHKTTMTFLNLFEGDLGPKVSEEKNKLSLLANSKQESNATVAKQLATVSFRLAPANQTLVEQQQLWKQWTDGSVFQQDLSKCPTRASTYVNAVRGCWQQLQRNRNLRSMTYSDEQFHTLAKLKTEDMKQKLLKLQQEECQATIHETVHSFGVWLAAAQRALVQAISIESDLEKFVEMLRAHDATLNEANETYEQMTQDLALLLGKDAGRTKNISNEESIERIIQAKRRTQNRYLLESLKEVSESHSEILSIMAENHSIMNEMQSTSLVLTDSLQNLDIEDLLK